MGHLFRMLRFALFLRSQGDSCIFFVNEHLPSLSILAAHGFDYKTVPLGSELSDWEQELIGQHDIKVWINDRLNTDAAHALRVIEAGVKLITFDDRGRGASKAHLNVAALVFEDTDRLKGMRVLSGVRYLILDETINRYRRSRSLLNRIIVTMGGSDTYGVSIEVVRRLRFLKQPVSVVVGPGFLGREELATSLPENFELLEEVPSLVETFFEYDLAITAGGVTPFEACASGLPCVVIATEDFELPIGRYIQQSGMGLFAGHYKDMNLENIIHKINVTRMSMRAMAEVDLGGAKRVYQAISEL